MAKFTFEYDDETRTINATGYKVQEIWNHIAGEQERRREWWRTYRAIRSGIEACRNDSGSDLSDDEVRDYCRTETDLLHGQLNPHPEHENAGQGKSCEVTGV